LGKGSVGTSTTNHILVGGMGAGFIGYQSNSTTTISGHGSFFLGSVNPAGAVRTTNIVSGQGSLLGGNITINSTNSGTGSFGWGNNLKVTNNYASVFGSNLATRLDNSVRVNTLDANSIAVNNGTILNNILSTNVTLNTGSLATQTGTNLSIALTRATNGNQIIFSELNSISAPGMIIQSISTNNTVVVNFYNPTSGNLQFSNQVRVTVLGY
jgi:hypothetical protein